MFIVAFYILSILFIYFFFLFAIRARWRKTAQKDIKMQFMLYEVIF
jgi:hypothetical protein